MAAYYYLVSGLPNLSIDDGKPPLTVSELRTEVSAHVVEKDRRLLDVLFLKFDNANFLARLRDPAAEAVSAGGVIELSAFDELLSGLSEEDGIPVSHNHLHIPPYFEKFARIYRSSQEKSVPQAVSYEDQLSSLYYEYGMKSGNEFVSSWFELNLNLNNVLTAVTCRKHGLDKTDRIVGDTETSRLLRTSAARDFGLGAEIEYLPEALRIAEEPNLFQREKRLDQLKWKWLDEATFFKTFTIEAVLSYLLEVELISRWSALDKTLGERVFRDMIGGMKVSSKSALSEFKGINKR